MKGLFCIFVAMVGLNYLVGLKSSLAVLYLYMVYLIFRAILKGE